MHTFTTDLWLWDARRSDTWTFVTVPEGVSVALEDEAELRGLRAGFGSVRVEVRIGGSRWRTSVFPDKKTGCFVLPVKKGVRRAEDLVVGDTVTVHLEVTPSG